MRYRKNVNRYKLNPQIADVLGVFKRIRKIRVTLVRVSCHTYHNHPSMWNAAPEYYSFDNASGILTLYPTPARGGTLDIIATQYVEL